MSRVFALVLLLVPLSARAQDAPVGEVPDPPNEPREVSDVELIRWAVNELRMHDDDPLPSATPESVRVDSEVFASGPNETERDALRVLAETGGGVLGLLVGGGLGTLVVWIASEADAAPDGMVAAGASAVLMGSLGLTSGVVLAGGAAGGSGNFGETLIGEVIGCLAALPLVVLGINEGSLAVAGAAASVLPLSGAMLAYELSHAQRAVAVIAPRRGGLALEVAGPIP